MPLRRSVLLIAPIFLLAVAILLSLAALSSSPRQISALNADGIFEIGFMYVLSLSALAWYWAERVRSAVFYQDRLRVSGRGVHLGIPYSELALEDIAMQPKTTTMGTSYFTAIRISGLGKPLLAPGNAKVGHSNTDLYTWLLERSKPDRNESPKKAEDPQSP